MPASDDSILAICACTGAPIRSANGSPASLEMLSSPRRASTPSRTSLRGRIAKGSGIASAVRIPGAKLGVDAGADNPARSSSCDFACWPRPWLSGVASDSRSANGSAGSKRPAGGNSRRFSADVTLVRPGVVEPLEVEALAGDDSYAIFGATNTSSRPPGACCACGAGDSYVGPCTDTAAPSRSANGFDEAPLNDANGAAIRASMPSEAIPVAKAGTDSSTRGSIGAIRPWASASRAPDSELCTAST